MFLPDSAYMLIMILKEIIGHTFTAVTPFLLPYCFNKINIHMWLLILLGTIPN